MAPPKSTGKKTDVLQGTLDLIVLRLLEQGPSNGWDLTQSIQVVSKGILSVNYGTLYPALHRLEAQGWLSAEWGTTDNNRRARIYQLTASGRTQLIEERKSWRRYTTALDLILGEW
jgi:PadR family transcriptional regulator PadR